MHTITATFEVVTPMFLGGADNKTTTELRAASIKGQLRFWWRALAWGRLQSLPKIREEEARIFGSSDKDVGQAGFSLQAKWLERPPILIPPPEHVSAGELSSAAQNKLRALKRRHRLTVDGLSDGEVIGAGARYLGYGLLIANDGRKKEGPPNNKYVVDVEVEGQLSRPCLFHRTASGRPARFCVRLMSRQSFTPDFLAALELFGLLSGLGARTRRGWGSVALVELTGDGVSPKWSPPADANDYGERIQNFVGAAVSCGSAPEYSAFFNNARILILPAGVTALEALSGLGDKFQLFRGWRHPSSSPEQNFKSDHDGFKINNGSWKISPGSFEVGYPTVALEHPLRVALGLPHNYSQRLKIEAEIQNRRASPLLFHIHRVGNEFVAVATVFPTRFLPDVIENSGKVRQEKIKIINGHHETLVANQVDYQIIDAFFDGFTPASGKPARDYFPVKKAILP